MKMKTRIQNMSGIRLKSNHMILPFVPVFISINTRVEIIKEATNAKRCKI